MLRGWGHKQESVAHFARGCFCSGIDSSRAARFSVYAHADFHFVRPSVLAAQFRYVAEVQRPS